ncbi:MAG: hypothetical protein JJ897_13520 [Marinibacterium sp.]|nr:hypothetical protein [Marinibacterium sp.]
MEHWRSHYNTVRPQGALEYRPPALDSIVPMDQGLSMQEQSKRTKYWGHATRTCSIASCSIPRGSGTSCAPKR